MLSSLGITPDGILGHSVGELGCAYADGSLTAKEAVLAAYWRGYCVEQAKLPPGGMAAVGMYSYSKSIVPMPVQSQKNCDKAFPTRLHVSPAETQTSLCV